MTKKKFRKKMKRLILRSGADSGLISEYVKVKKLFHLDGDELAGWLERKRKKPRRKRSARAKGREDLEMAAALALCGSEAHRERGALVGQERPGADFFRQNIALYLTAPDHVIDEGGDHAREQQSALPRKGDAHEVSRRPAEEEDPYREVRRLLSKGMTIDAVAAATGCSQEEASLLKRLM